MLLVLLAAIRASCEATPHEGSAQIFKSIVYSPLDGQVLPAPPPSRLYIQRVHHGMQCQMHDKHAPYLFISCTYREESTSRSDVSRGKSEPFRCSGENLHAASIAPLLLPSTSYLVQGRCTTCINIYQVYDCCESTFFVVCVWRLGVVHRRAPWPGAETSNGPYTWCERWLVERRRQGVGEVDAQSVQSRGRAACTLHIAHCTLYIHCASSTGTKVQNSLRIKQSGRRSWL